MRAVARKAAPPLPPGLPPALSDWAAVFETMPEPQLRVLGRLMASIGPLVETVERALQTGVEEFDGYDGVAAAGRIERALVSELLWRQLAPVEFVRRVAENELLRHNPVHRDRADDRAIIAMIDCGPRILGRRRLVALATLLCLGVAARRRSARLIWCSTAFDPADPWRDGLDRRGLAMFCQRTGMSGLTPALSETLWSAAPEQARERETVLWGIGPAGFDLGAIEAANRLEVDEVGLWRGEEWIQEAEARLTASSGARRLARFAYPEEEVCAALLRAPFRAGASKQKAEEVGWGVGWAPRWLSGNTDDHGALLRMADGVLAMHGTEPQWFLELKPEMALMGLRWLENGPRAALWREGGRLLAAQLDEQGSVFWRGEAVLDVDHPLIAQSHPAGSLPGLIRGAGRKRLLASAPDGSIYEVGFGDPDGGVLVEPARGLETFRLLARRRTWMLGWRVGDPPGRYLAVHTRKDTRIALQSDTEASALAQVDLFWPIHEKGLGALVRERSGWRWLTCGEPPEWLTPPPLGEDAALIALHHQAVSPNHAERVGWIAAHFWSFEDGLQKAVLRADGQWRLQGGDPFAAPAAERSEILAIDSRIYALAESETASGPLRLVADAHKGEVEIRDFEMLKQAAPWAAL